MPVRAQSCQPREKHVPGEHVSRDSHSHERNSWVLSIDAWGCPFERSAEISLNTINRCGEHLLSLLNDILEMSKIEAGRTTLNLSAFDLHALIDDLEAMFRLRADTKKLHFIVERLGAVPRHITGDESKLRQVLINLLGNALKFTEKGGVVLSCPSAT